MLRVLRLLLVLYVTVILQTMLVPKIEILGIGPDLPFLVVLLVALREGAAGGAIAGFVAGLVVDTESAQTLGQSCLVNSIVGFATGAGADRIVRESAAARTVVAFLAVLVRDQCIASFTLAESFLDGLRFVVTFAIPGAAYTAIFAGVLMAAVDRFVNWEGEKKRAHR